MPDCIGQTAVPPMEGDGMAGMLQGAGAQPDAAGAAEDAVALGLHPQNDVIGKQGEAVSPRALFI